MSADVGQASSLLGDAWRPLPAQNEVRHVTLSEKIGVGVMPFCLTQISHQAAR